MSANVETFRSVSNTAYKALPSAVLIAYPDIRYFQNVIHFHGIWANVTWFTVVRKVPPFLLRFSWYWP